MLLEAFLLIVAVSVIEAMALQGVPLMIAYGIIIVLCIALLFQNRRLAPPFIPTSNDVVETMMRLANVSAGDLVYDLGCGDGRLLIAAAKRGARAIGYEYSIPTFLLAKFRTDSFPTITVILGDFWKRDYRDADVICCYLLKEKMVDVEKRIWPTLKKGTRVISHTFEMPTVKHVKKEGGGILYVK